MSPVSENVHGEVVFMTDDFTLKAFFFNMNIMTDRF